MPSQFGKTIRSRRQEIGLSLRGLARAIGKSPSFIVEIERSERLPAISEDTLREVANAIQVEPDLLIVLAGKTPTDVTPKSVGEVELYRMIRGLPADEQEQVKRYIRSRRK